MIYAAFVALLAGANASPLAVEPTAIAVPYLDLDLGSAVGRKKLDRRIAAAVRRACDEPRLPGAAQQARISECIKQSRAAARLEVEQALAKSAMQTELARNQIGGAKHL